MSALIFIIYWNGQSLPHFIHPFPQKTGMEIEVRRGDKREVKMTSALSALGGGE